MNKTLAQLNALYRHLGTWQEVANQIGYNRATINKWFAGTRTPSPLTRKYIAGTLAAIEGE